MKGLLAAIVDYLVTLMRNVTQSMDILLDTRPSQGPIKCPLLRLLKNLLQSPYSNRSLSLSHLSGAEAACYDLWQ